MYLFERMLYCEVVELDCLSYLSANGAATENRLSVWTFWSILSYFLMLGI